MNWITFRAKMFDLACFNIHQVYAWQPGFDRNNMVRWTRKGYLIRLRQGVYTFPEYKAVPDASAYFAGRMYSPSYISLHTALSFYGLIPEAVVQITSVTSLKTATFTNGFGDFSYRSVKSELMFGYEPRKVMDGRSLSFATREKAVLDLLYLYPSQPDYGFLAAKCGINKLQELKAAISKRLDSVDLQQKKKDFEHLLFNQSSSDRILHFKDFIQAL